MPAILTRRRGLTAARWTPGKLPTLEAWYRAQRITGLADGAAVTTWSDLSTHGRDVTQATSTKRPAWRATAINGKASVDADGADDYLQSSAFTAIAQPLTIMLVGRMQTAPALNQQRRFCDGGSDAQMTLFANNAAGNTKWVQFAGSSLVGPAYDTNWHTFVDLVNGASSKIRVDGGAGTAGGSGANTLTGVTLFNSGGGGTTRLMDGDIAELVVCSSSLSLADINKFGAYAAAEYGLAWTTAT